MNSLFFIFARLVIGRIAPDYNLYSSIMNAANIVPNDEFEQPTTYSKRFEMPFTDDQMAEWYRQSADDQFTTFYTNAIWSL